MPGGTCGFRRPGQSDSGQGDHLLTESAPRVCDTRNINDSRCKLTEGFDCPHGIFTDRRKGDPELYVADRTNHRVRVYDMEGRFKRSFEDDFLSSPSGFVTDGDLMVIAELRARLAVIGRDDNLFCYLGDNEGVCSKDGWPNGENQDGEVIPTGLLQPGLFNSPHGMAVDKQGNLFVAEWLIGGRLTKLENLRSLG